MIKQNQFFNSPAFAQAADNISAMFSPTSGAEASGWASAAAKKDEAARLAWLFDNYGDPSASARSSLVGVQGYGQTPAGFAATDATNRRGQDIASGDRRYDTDIDSRTTLTTNVADNERALATNQLDNRRAALTGLYGPLNQGQLRPEVPEEMVRAVFGDDFGPIAAAQGVPKPLSETELKAQQMQRLLRSGSLTDDDMLNTIMGDDTPVKVAGPDGPVFMSPGAAVRTAAPAFVDRGAEAKPTNAVALLADGAQVPAIQGPDGRWRHAQTGEELPADIKVFDMPKPQGSAEEIGLTQAVTSDVQNTILSIDNTLETAGTLRELISENPSSQGAVGGIRRFAQNLMQMANELGQMGPGMAEVTEAVRNGMLDTGTATEFFDPTLPDIELLTNFLAWNYAKSFAGGKVSNEQLKQAKAAIGGGSLLSNQPDSIARLDRLIEQLQSQRQRYGQLSPGIPGVSVNAPAAAPASGEETWERGPDGSLRRVQ